MLHALLLAAAIAVSPQAPESDCGNNASLSELRSQAQALGFKWADHEINTAQAVAIIDAAGASNPPPPVEVHYLSVHYGNEIPAGQVVVALYDDGQCFLGATLLQGETLANALRGTGI